MKVTIVTYVMILFVGLVITASNYEIRDYDEAVYLNAVEIMRNTGDFLVPKYYWGEERLNKPIGLYWLVLMSQSIFGKSLISARLISIFSAVLVLFLTYLLTKLICPDERNSGASVLILGSTPFFIHMALLIKPEMTLVACVAASHYFMFRLILLDSTNIWDELGFYGFLGLGFMIKGPPAVAFPALTLITYSISSKSFTPFMKVIAMRGIAFFLAIVLPWYIFVYLSYGWNYFTETLNREILQRLMFDNQSYSRGLFVLYLAPWVWLALIAVFRYFKRNENSSNGLIISWFISSLLAMVIIREFHTHYLLNIAVPTALLSFGVLRGIQLRPFAIVYLLMVTVFLLSFMIFGPTNVIDHARVWPLFAFTGLCTIIFIFIKKDLILKTMAFVTFAIVISFYSLIWTSIQISPLNSFFPVINSDRGSLITSNRLINIDFSFFWWKLDGKYGSRYYPDRDSFVETILNPPNDVKWAICSAQLHKELEDVVNDQWEVVDNTFFTSRDFGQWVNLSLNRNFADDLFVSYYLLRYRSD